MVDVTPVVYVVDDDVSVRESLELLIRTPAGGRRHANLPRNFCLAYTFLFRAVWFSTFLFRV